MGEPPTTTMSNRTADARAQRIATQAANYARAVAAGVPHDPDEVASILGEVKALHIELAGGGER
ncbi:hypothetical protein ACFOY2_20505 [Nonomuraea purpurea]|uniref:Uncharacterized protein n=1 Tax=Nonomuraea purpurea TaxID=1849276 RepID=A0ABV8G6J3_9ACTN